MTSNDDKARYLSNLQQIIAAGGDVTYELIEAVACRTVTVEEVAELLGSEAGGVDSVLLQALINAVAAKPNATVADAADRLRAEAAKLQQLKTDFDALVQVVELIPTDGGLLTGPTATSFQDLLDALAGKPGSTVADVQAQFAMMATAIGDAIASGMKALPDKITLNRRGDNPGKVTIASWNLDTPRQPVDIDFEPMFGGNVTVGGKRILTEGDTPGSVDAAQLAAAVAAATAPLTARIDALETELAKKANLAYVQEQFGNFNDVHEANYTQTAQLVLSEQTKLQNVINALAAKTNATVTDITNWRNGIQGDVEALADMFNQALQMINEVVEYVVTEYATKVEMKKVADTLTALIEALGGTTPTDVADWFAKLNNELGEFVAQLISEGFDERIPRILEALQTHLENVLAIFGGGGTTGVTPAQITELTAEIARVYATKDQLTAALQPYAKKNDADQEIVARAVTTRGILFSITDEALAPLDYPDYGTRVSIIPKDATTVDEAGIVVVHTDLADLVPNAARELPAPQPWTPVTYAGGASGTVEARTVNGTVVFRGQLVKTHGGDPAHVFTLPAGIPAPASVVEVAVPGEETGVGYRIAAVRVQTDGRVFLTAPQRVTHTSMSDIAYLMEQ